MTAAPDSDDAFPDHLIRGREQIMGLAWLAMTDDVAREWAAVRRSAIVVVDPLHRSALDRIAE